MTQINILEFAKQEDQKKNVIKLKMVIKIQ